MEALETRIAPAAISWDGGGGDLKWNTAANWSGDIVPGVNDDVTIDVAGTITVALGPGAHSIHSLNSHENLLLNDGGLTLAAASSISGDVTLTGTSLTVNGALTISGAFAVGGGATTDGSALLTLMGATTAAGNWNVGGNVTNTGTLTATAANLGFSNAAFLTNAATGVFNVKGNSWFSGDGTIANAGTMNNVSGAQLVFSSLNNTGTLNVDGGSLELRGIGTNSSIIDVDAGAQIAFVAGTGNNIIYHLTPGTQLKGAGLYLVDGFGILQVEAGLTISPAHLEIGGFSYVGGDGNTTMQSGSIVKLNGGNFTGAGKTTIAAGATMDVTSNGGGLENHTLDLYGTMNTDASPFIIHNSSTLNIEVGGVVNARGLTTFYGGASVVNILGTLNVDAAGTFFNLGTATASLSGMVHVTAGNFAVNTSLASTGIFNADAGTFVSFNGGNPVMNPGTQWNGLGHYTVNAGTVSVPSGVTLTVHNLYIDAALANGGMVNIDAGGVLDFHSGSLSGAGVTDIASTATVTGDLVLLSGTVNNHGSFTTQGIIGGTLNNLGGATLSFTAVENGVAGASGTALFNSGTVNFDASGAQGMNFSGNFRNDGVLNVTGGTLALNVTNVGMTASSTGEFHAGAGATLHFASSPGFNFNTGTSFTGTGTFKFSGNYTLVDAAQNLSPTHLSLAGAVLNGPGRITASSGDEWFFNGGTLRNMGELDIQSGAVVHLQSSFLLDGTVGKNFGLIDGGTSFGSIGTTANGGTFTNEASGVINFDPAAGNQFSFNSSAAIVNRGVISKGEGAGSLIFFSTLDNSGTLEISAGTATIFGTLAQLSPDKTILTGGTWKVFGGATLNVTGLAQTDSFGHPLVSVTTNAADVTISGVGANFNALNNLGANTGTLRVLDGATLSSQLFDAAPATDPGGPLPGPLANSGTLEIGPRSTVNVTTGFTQSAGGKLVFHVAGPAATNGAGQLAVAETATLDGTLELQVDGTFVPPVGDNYLLATYAAAQGDFAVFNGVQPLFSPLKAQFGYIATAQNVPSDLVPQTITPPVGGAAGQSVTIPFTVKNQAVIATASNAWTDSLYLSTSATFDSSAILLGRVPHTGALAAGGSYSAQFSGNLPPLLAGAYHLFLLTDSAAQVAESDNANNLLGAAGTVAISVPTLTAGTTLDGVINSGEELLFRVALPAGSSKVHFTGPAVAEAELYLRHAAPPSPAVSDFFAFDATSVEQSLTVADSGDGDYYVLLRGRDGAAGGAAFHLSADPLAFSVESTGPVAGTNNGDITLTLHGAQLSTTTALSLVPHAGGTALTPSKVVVRDATTVFVTFNLRGATVGAYDLHAVNGLAALQLDNAFSVLAAPALDPEVEISLAVIGPAGIRVGRESSILVTYSNPSGHDVPAPFLVLYADNGTFKYPGEDFFMPGYTEFFALDPNNGDPTILPAGYHGSQSFKFLPAVQGGGLVSHVAIDFVDPAAAVNYTKIEGLVRPPGTTDAEWAPVLAILKTRLGATYESLEQVLRGDERLLPPDLPGAHDYSKLLAIEADRAFAQTVTSIRGVATSADSTVDLTGRIVLAHNLTTGESFSAETLNDGSFTIFKVSPGQYSFDFEQVLVQNAPITVAAGQHVTGLSLGLVAGAAISGSITAGGLPVEDAHISAIDATGHPRDIFSDEAGHYTLGGLAAGVYTIVIDAPGKARTVLDQVTVTAAGFLHNFALADEGKVTGAITLGAGGPAAGRLVVTAHLSSGGDALHTFSVATNGNTFTLDQLPAGTYDLDVTRPGYVARHISGVTVTAGDVTALGTLALADGASVRGTVTSADPRLPASGAEIVVRQGSTVVATTATDATGAFTIDGLAAGDYTVDFADTAGSFHTPLAVTLTAGQDKTGLALAAHPGGGIAGVVTDSTTSAPLAHITVFLTDAAGAVFTTATDNTGHYAFSNLAAGSYNVAVHLAGAGSSHAAAVTKLDGVPVSTDLQAHATARISGQLRLADGTPVANGSVTLLSGGEEVGTAQTDENGNYAFSINQAGTYDVQAEAGTASFAPLTGIVVAAGADLTANPVAGQGTLAVHVTDPTISVAGTLLLLKENSTGEVIGAALLDATGVATFSHLAAGDYTVIAAGSDNRGARMVATVAGSGTTNASVAQAQLASVTGHIALTGGSGSYAHPLVGLYPASGTGGALIAAVDASGNYSVPNVAAGTYNLVVFNDGYTASVQSNLTVAGNTVQDASLTPSNTSLTGRVLDEFNLPIAGATVTLVDASGRVVGLATTKTDGTWLITSGSGSGLTLKISTSDAPLFTFSNTLQLDPFEMRDVGDIQYALYTTDDGVTLDFQKPPILRLPEFLKIIFEKEFIRNPVEVQSLAQLPAGCEAMCGEELAAAQRAKDAQDLAKEAAMDYFDALQKNAQAARTTIGGELGENVKNFGGILLTVLGLTRLASAAPALLLTSAGANALDLGVEISNALDAPKGEDFVTSLTKALNSGTKGADAFGNALKALAPELEEAGSKLFKGIGPLGQIIDAAVNGKKILEKVAFPDSIQFANQVTELDKLFEAALKRYNDAVTVAYGKKLDYDRCRANASTDGVDCNPPPKDPPKNDPDLLGPRPPQSFNPFQGFAFDPNDIVGPLGSGAEHYVPVATPLPYTIHFENQASATAPAAEVKVTSTLDPNLNFGSLRFTEFGFGGRTFAIPAGRSSFSERLDLRSELGVFVDFEAGVNLTTGEVHWSIRAIDPATGDVPDNALLGFLPPNLSGGEGEGFVSYTVQANASSHTGDVIDAQASIVFDSNAPISTVAIANTIDAVAPTSAVAPLPLHSGSDFTVSWSGSDDAGGSGLTTYNVFVRDVAPGSIFTPLALGTTHHAAVFHGVVGHTYEFYSVGIDGAGNQEALPVVADTTVTIQDGVSFNLDAQHPVSVHNADGKLVKVSLKGHGSGTVTLANGVADTADLRAIVLSNTDATSSLSISVATGGTVHVGRIETGAAALGTLSFGKGVIFGDGYDDGAVDLSIGGAMKTLTLSDVAAYAHLKIGQNLAPAAAATSSLAVTLGSVLGEGAETDFFGKLRSVTVRSWAYEGLLSAPLGVGALTVTTGDFLANVDLDSASTVAGTAQLGAVKTAGGGLFSASFAVEGKLTSLSVKAAIQATVTASEIGNITTAGIFGSTLRARTGNLGNITSSKPIVGSTIIADHGAIGNITVALANQTGSVNAIDFDFFGGRSIRNVTASVSGAAGLTSARAIANTFFDTTGAGIGNVRATVSGAALHDGAAIDLSGFISRAGKIGTVTATATSGEVAPTLAAMRESSLFATGAIGNISAIATATHRAPTGGTVAAIQSAIYDLAVTGDSVGTFTAKATGSANAIALDLATDHRLTVTSAKSIGAITLQANRGKTAGAVAYAAAHASFFAGTDIGAIAVSGDASQTQVSDSVFYAGGKIASLAVAATDKVSGAFVDSFAIAGQSRVLAKATDLVAASLGPVTVSGSIAGSQILANGNIGAIKVGGALTNSYFVAGVDVGDDKSFLSVDDTYSRHGSIASLTAAGALTASTIAAGIDPGADHLFGSADDAVGLAVGTIATRSRVGAVQLGAATVPTATTTPFAGPVVFNHTDAIESLTLTSIRIGTRPVFTNFTSPVYIDGNGDGVEQGNEVLIRKL